MSTAEEVLQQVRSAALPEGWRVFRFRLGAAVGTISLFGGVLIVMLTIHLVLLVGLVQGKLPGSGGAYGFLALSGAGVVAFAWMIWRPVRELFYFRSNLLVVTPALLIMRSGGRTKSYDWSAIHNLKLNSVRRGHEVDHTLVFEHPTPGERVIFLPHEHFGPVPEVAAAIEQTRRGEPRT